MSDIVAVAEVIGTEKLADLNEYYDSQEVTCAARTILAGKSRTEFSFRQDFSKLAGAPAGEALRPKDRVLLFYGNEHGRRKSEVIFWINLTRPGARRTVHAAYNNDGRWLGDGEAVIARVKTWLGKNQQPKDRKKRGLIVPFADADSEMYWDFVRTADPEYKSVLVNALRKGDEGNKESAIYNLVSYPGQETADLIRPFLRNPATSEMRVADGKDRDGNTIYKTVRFYPLRQAAYTALKLLGEAPARPEGFYDHPFLWLFRVGFERRAYFPHGDWKHFD